MTFCPSLLYWSFKSTPSIGHSVWLIERVHNQGESLLTLSQRHILHNLSSLTSVSSTANYFALITDDRIAFRWPLRGWIGITETSSQLRSLPRLSNLRVEWNGMEWPRLSNIRVENGMKWNGTQLSRQSLWLSLQFIQNWKILLTFFLILSFNCYTSLQTLRYTIQYNHDQDFKGCQ